MLLDNGFENFIKTCFRCYGLDFCYYISAPGLSSDAIQKITSVKSELFSDTDMNLFMKKETWSRISYTVYLPMQWSKQVNQWR